MATPESKRSMEKMSTMMAEGGVGDIPVDFSGYIFKMGGAKGGRKSWKRRWFVLKAGCLYYYKSRDDNVLMGIMPLSSCVVYDHGALYQSSPVWKLSDECKVCRQKFGLVLRRHHCRACGHSFCQTDSSQIVQLPRYGHHQPVRVCDSCALQVSQENKKFLRNSSAQRPSIFNTLGGAPKSSDIEMKRGFMLPSEFKPNMFAVKNVDRELWLHCNNSAERVRWVTHINESRDRSTSTSAEGHKQWEMDNKQLERTEKVAEGSFGDVYRGNLWGTKVAIKTLKQLDNTHEALLEDLKQEVKILSQLRHPNVVLYIGACTTPPDICIVTEWCLRGSLYDLLHDPKIQVNCKMIIDMCLGIAQGMNYLHCLEKPIIHRDLKSYNILIDKSFGVKVADFGLSLDYKRRSDATTTESDMPNDIYGTPEWMAPEVMQGEHYDEKIDVYSYGVMLTELLTRQKPFSDQFKIRGYQDVFEQVLDNDAIPTIPNWSQNFIKPLVNSCLSREPSRRPSFNDIILYLQEFLHLDEAYFFLQFDFPRLMHFLNDTKYQFQALGAAELANLAFHEKFRNDQVVPDWAAPAKDAKIDGRPYSFTLPERADLHNLITKLADLVGNRRSLVQLSSCRALKAVLEVFENDSKKMSELVTIVHSRNTFSSLCTVLGKDSKSLYTAASGLVMCLVKHAPEPEVFDALQEEEVRVLARVLGTEVAKLHESHLADDEQIQRCNQIELTLQGMLGGRRRSVQVNHSSSRS